MESADDDDPPVALDRHAIGVVISWICEIRDHPAVEPPVAVIPDDPVLRESKSSHARPTATILPSDWIATSAALSLLLPRTVVVTVPSSSNVGSSAPAVVYRATANRSFPVPATTIFPSLWICDGRGGVGGRPEVGRDDPSPSNVVSRTPPLSTGPRLNRRSTSLPRQSFRLPGRRCRKSPRGRPCRSWRSPPCRMSSRAHRWS